MAQTVKERLLSYLKVKGLSQGKFERMCGLSNGYVNNLRRSVTAEKLAAIKSVCTDLNTDWLLTGEGEMLIDKSSSDKAVINYKDGVPYYDEDFILGFNELGFPSSENPEFLVRMPKYSNATLWCNATGHSMEPEINNGDVIALQLIEDPSFLFTGDLYAIVTTKGLRTIKRIGKGKDDNHYRLIPTNKQYEEQDIPKSVILRVFRVLGNLHSF